MRTQPKPQGCYKISTFLQPGLVEKLSVAVL